MVRKSRTGNSSRTWCLLEPQPGWLLVASYPAALSLDADSVFTTSGCLHFHLQSLCKRVKRRWLHLHKRAVNERTIRGFSGISLLREYACGRCFRSEEARDLCGHKLRSTCTGENCDFFLILRRSCPPIQWIHTPQFPSLDPRRESNLKRIYTANDLPAVDPATVCKKTFEKDTQHTTCKCISAS